MSEIMRFRVARAPQRSLPLSENFVPLYYLNVDTATVATNAIPSSVSQIDNFLNTLLSNPNVVAFANSYIASSGIFVSNASHLTSPIVRLDVWLSQNNNRPDPKKLILELGATLIDVKNLMKTADWIIDRRNVANSLVLSMITDVDPSIRAFLHRILLVFGLVELLVENPGRLKTPDDVYWALRWRTVSLPPQLVTYLRGRRSILVRRPGRADMYVVKDEWIKYEAGEISYIENILPGETKDREHISLTETEQTSTTEQETTQTNERDSQTTDKSDLHDEASTDTNLAIHIDGKVDTSGQYGPTHVDTHIGGDLNYSQAQSQKHATNQATETIARAVTKVEEHVRNVRTMRTLTRITETNKHSITNADITKPVVGIYRWVEKIQRLQIFRYPNRFLLEFQVPEPGAWWRWLQDQGKNKGVLTKDPGYFTVDGQVDSAINPLLKASDISNDPNSSKYYLKLGSRYSTTGLTPYPEDKVVAVALKRDSIDDPGTADEPKEHQWYKFTTDVTMSIPDGYSATNWEANVISVRSQAFIGHGSLRLVLSVGASQTPIEITGATLLGRHVIGGTVGGISTGIIPVSLMSQIAAGFAINIDVKCKPTLEAIEKWKISSYDQIAASYFALKRQHEDEIAALSINKGIEITGSSPERNKEIVRDELKKLVIEMLTGARFKGRPAIILEGSQPHVDLSEAPKISSEIQFLEQAFEWENLTYIFYPYYWAGDDHWTDLADLDSTDTDFARFLRAGSVRVIVPARPGFDEQVNLYTDIGVLWGGGPVPSPQDENYISVAAEIKAQSQAPREGQRGESWEVRLPTTLIWLENSAGLPVKPIAQRKLDDPPGQIL